MFKMWPEDLDWSWHLLRPIGEAIYGGAEFNECYRTACRIRAGDREEWHREWKGLAEQVEGKAGEEEEKGHRVTARDHYLRACGYYRWAEFFLEPDDPRRLATFGKSVDCFQKAGAYFQPPLRRVEVPFEGGTLPGYFILPGRTNYRVPGVFYVAGADVLKEELYFLGGKACLERGMALLIVDCPGQGESLKFRKTYSRADYEKPISACLDYLEAQPEVDPARIAIVGRSFGGYYVSRGAAFDKRIKACVIFGALYDGLEVFDSYPTARRNFQWLLGAHSPEEARDKLKQFTLAGVMEKISCPLLVIHGEDDFLVPVSQAYRMFEEARCRKELKIYKSGELGAVHCQYDSFPETIPLIFDWVKDRLQEAGP